MTDVSVALSAGFPEAAASCPTQNPCPSPVQERLVFTGAGGEYFRIWIVNLLLTILTLGIYSAWAKVRRERWFLRHTRLEDSPFDYHGSPMAILKGRALVVLILVVLNMLARIHPAFSLVTSVVFLFALPWIITRSLRFRAANSSWRGLRFGFRGGIGGAVKAFILWPMLVPFTLGLIFPLAVKKQKEYVFNHLGFGGSDFALELPAGKVYGIYLKAAALPVLGFIGMVTLISMKLSWAGLILLWVAMLGAVPFVMASMSNLVWGRMALGPCRFASDQRPGQLYAVWFKNVLLTVLTLGFYRPFAAVNLWHYRVEHLSVSAGEPLDGFVAAQQEQVRVFGQEAGDLLDIDFGV